MMLITAKRGLFIGKADGLRGRYGNKGRHTPNDQKAEPRDLRLPNGGRPQRKTGNANRVGCSAVLGRSLTLDKKLRIFLCGKNLTKLNLAK